MKVLAYSLETSATRHKKIPKTSYLYLINETEEKIHFCRRAVCNFYRDKTLRNGKVSFVYLIVGPVNVIRILDKWYFGLENQLCDAVVIK